MWNAYFAFHISIAHAKVEGIPELCRGSVVERDVGTLVVVALLLVCQSLPHIAKHAEPACVEALVTQSAMEALDVAVLHRSPRLDVNQADLTVLGPTQHPPEVTPVHCPNACSSGGRDQRSAVPEFVSPGQSQGSY